MTFPYHYSEILSPAPILSDWQAVYLSSGGVGCIRWALKYDIRYAAGVDTYGDLDKRIPNPSYSSEDEARKQVGRMAKALHLTNGEKDMIMHRVMDLMQSKACDRLCKELNRSVRARRAECMEWILSLSSKMASDLACASDDYVDELAEGRLDWGTYMSCIESGRMDNCREAGIFPEMEIATRYVKAAKHERSKRRKEKTWTLKRR